MSRSAPTRCTSRSRRAGGSRSIGRTSSPTALRSAKSARITFPIVQATVDEIVRVSNDEICAAIKDIFDDTRTIMEPAGALAVAGLRAWVERAGVDRRAPRGGAERREHELRSPAVRRRARGARRCARGAVRRDHPGAARRIPRLLRHHRSARSHGIQLPAERSRRRAHLRRHRHAVAPGCRRLSRDAERGRLRDRRSDR